jgi:hypothetical protein
MLDDEDYIELGKQQQQQLPDLFALHKQQSAPQLTATTTPSSSSSKFAVPTANRIWWKKWKETSK